MSEHSTKLPYTEQMNQQWAHYAEAHHIDPSDLSTKNLFCSGFCMGLAAFEAGAKWRDEQPSEQASGKVRISVDAALAIRAKIERAPGVTTTYSLADIETWLAAGGITVSDD